MDSILYLNIFQQTVDKLDKKLFDKKQIKSAVGIYGESVFLKLYKLGWANKSENPLFSTSRIFFSIWINDKAIKENKLLYNIHALKLRKLNGYKITSRDFAANFRTRFKSVEHNWPNVSTAFGPLTLMEGFVEIDLNNFQSVIALLANNFLAIDHFVDELLDERKTDLKNASLP